MMRKYVKNDQQKNMILSRHKINSNKWDKNFRKKTNNNNNNKEIVIWTTSKIKYKRNSCHE